MLAKLRTFALLGIDAVPVEVEVDANPGTAKIILVGLPEMAVRESVHRIERALANLGYARPTGRTIINLAPADLRKDAGGFDLPIALGILVSTRQLTPEQLKDFGSIGELSLDGQVRPVKGALSTAMAARDLGVIPSAQKSWKPFFSARDGNENSSRMTPTPHPHGKKYPANQRIVEAAKNSMATPNRIHGLRPAHHSNSEMSGKFMRSTPFRRMPPAFSHTGSLRAFTPA